MRIAAGRMLEACGPAVDTFSEPYGIMAKAMRITVNGESHEVADGSSIASLLDDLQVQTDRVAVELNLKVVDRGDFDQAVLHEGDRVEVLGFIGGGARPGVCTTTD